MNDYHYFGNSHLHPKRRRLHRSNNILKLRDLRGIVIQGTLTGDKAYSSPERSLQENF